MLTRSRVSVAAPLWWSLRAQG